MTRRRHTTASATAPRASESTAAQDAMADAEAHSSSLAHHEHHDRHDHHPDHHHHLHLLRHHHHAIAWPKTPPSSSELVESTTSHSAMIGVEIDTKHTHHDHRHHRDLHLPRHHHDARHFDHRAAALVGEAIPPTTTATTKTTSESSATSPPCPSHVLAMDEIKPIFKFKSKRTGNTKVLNLHGLRHLFVILLTMPMWMIGLEVMHALGDAFPGFDDDRGRFDGIGKMWCKSYLGMTDCYPIIEGDIGRLSGKDIGGPCLFVANHASFLDIAVLCCALDPTFKFIAKDSLEKFPGVGRQLVGVSFCWASSCLEWHFRSSIVC